MPSAYVKDNPKARKPHRCCECCGIIQPGEHYWNHHGVWDGQGSTFKVCADCETLKEELDKKITDFYEKIVFQGLIEYVFDGHNKDDITRLMDIRRKRGAPLSPRLWMENRELELKQKVEE